MVHSSCSLPCYRDDQRSDDATSQRLDWRLLQQMRAVAEEDAVIDTTARQTVQRDQPQGVEKEYFLES